MIELVLPADSTELWRLEGKFRANVDKDGPIPPHAPHLGCCWIWTGRTQKRGDFGYGELWVPGCEDVLAHRLSWVLYKRKPIPHGKLVLHRCDNPPCVRPSHLFTGTHADNAYDRDCKKRGGHGMAPAVGEGSGNHKLHNDDIIFIRRCYAEGGATQKGLSIRFGVLERTIWEIIHHKRWKHIQP